jgi:carboxylesterase
MMFPMRGTGDPSPVFVPAKGPAALCLHGFTGTPYDVAPVAHALADAGFAVSAPLLAGHGQDAAALTASTWNDWVASAGAALDRIKVASDGGRVTLVGFSMGGLLALRLARTRPDDVAALALLSVPLRLPDWQARILRGFGHLPGFLKRRPFASLRKRGGSDVTDDRVRNATPSLPHMPLASLSELVALGDVVRRDLPFIAQPAFVAHGARDHTVPRSAAFELAGSLASPTVERLWLPRSGHLVILDVEHVELCAAVVRFLAAHARPAEAGATSRGAAS